MISLLLALLLGAGQWGEVVTVRYVLFSVRVADHYNRPVTHLKKDDFTLWVDLNKIPIEHFSHDFSAPLSTLILLDYSGSMDMGKRPLLVNSFLRKLLLYRREGDEMALVLFQNRKIKTVIPFPGKNRAFFDLIPRFEPRGKTALYDALSRINNEVKRGKNDRKQIILITDSHDNFSEAKPGTAIHIIQALDIPVHVVCLPLSPEEPLDIKFLRSLSRFTGGSLHIIKRGADIGPTLTRLLSMMRHQYLIGFAPSSTEEVKYHRVKIDVKGRLKVITRKGYTGPSPPKTH